MVRIEVLGALREAVAEYYPSTLRYWESVLAAGGVNRSCSVAYAVFTSSIMLTILSNVGTMTPRKAAVECYRFCKGVGDFEKAPETFMEPDMLEYGIFRTRVLSMLDDSWHKDFSDTVYILASSIARIGRENFSLDDFAKSLTATVLDEAPKLYSEEVYERKAAAIGALVASRASGSSIDPQSLLRLAFEALPKGNVYIADMLMYVMSRVLELWRLDKLNVPIDRGLRRVLENLNIPVPKSIRSCRSRPYKMVQEIAKSVDPKSPEKLYTLSYMELKLCRKKRCIECPLRILCKRSV